MLIVVVDVVFVEVDIVLIVSSFEFVCWIDDLVEIVWIYMF